jgi:hypothetical protein
MVSKTEQCATLANEGTRTLKHDPKMGCEWIEDKLERASATEKLASTFDYLF